MNERTVIAAAKTSARQTPVFVKNAEVLAESIKAPAMFRPRTNTSLGDIGPLPDAVCPICSKLSTMAGTAPDNRSLPSRPFFRALGHHPGGARARPHASRISSAEVQYSQRHKLRRGGI